MNEKTITITGTDDRLKKLLEHIEFGNITPFPEIVEQIRSQLALSDRELFLKVIRGQWEPGVHCNYYPVNKITGKILSVHNNYSAGGLQEQREEFYFAPTKELAEILSKVITGQWRPKKGEVIYSLERATLKYVYEDDGDTMGADVDDYLFNRYAYFPTATQRDSFARQQEEKPKIEPKFYNKHGNLLLNYVSDGCSETDASAELNRIRTELARLSPKETK